MAGTFCVFAGSCRRFSWSTLKKAQATVPSCVTDIFWIAFPDRLCCAQRRFLPPVFCLLLIAFLLLSLPYLFPSPARASLGVCPCLSVYVGVCRYLWVCVLLSVYVVIYRCTSISVGICRYMWVPVGICRYMWVYRYLSVPVGICGCTRSCP